MYFDLGGFYSICKCGIHLAGEFCLLPSHIVLVFQTFEKRPDDFPNRLMVLTVSSNEFLSPASVISLPSAYYDFFNSVSPIKILFIFLFCEIIMAIISTHNMNKYDDIWSSCLHPLWIANHCDNCPLPWQMILYLYKNIDIHWHISGPKPKAHKTLNINFQSTESKAFFKV